MKFLKKRASATRDPKREVDEDDFSDFFIHADAGKQKKVIKEAMDSASKRQSKMLVDMGFRTKLIK